LEILEITCTPAIPEFILYLQFTIQIKIVSFELADIHRINTGIARLLYPQIQR